MRMMTNMPYCPLTVFNKTPGCFEQTSSWGRNLLAGTVYKKQLLATSIWAAPTTRATPMHADLGGEFLFVCFFPLHQSRFGKKHACFSEQSTLETTSHCCNAHPAFPTPSSIPGWVCLVPAELWAEPALLSPQLNCSHLSCSSLKFLQRAGGRDPLSGPCSAQQQRAVSGKLTFWFFLLEKLYSISKCFFLL